MHLRCIGIRRIDENTVLLCRICSAWIAGLSLGYLAARFYGDTLGACVSASVSVRPTWAGVLSVNFFPLLISACAVYFSGSLAFWLCLLRGSVLGLGFGGVCLAFPGAGLAVSVLLMFSAVLFAPVMLWYYERRLRWGRMRFGSDTALCLLLSLLTAWADMELVAPMLPEIMNF